ncbi:hypothetical protein L228DRAFT_146947 [Xylona heveae TC161]|uniref:Uncharacterized protein n=1 Tax=Xylona heveae (strain CBS 132557 / TC161) TaxID=1328760 RepID=A0A165GFT7_XYLHT|nr:hypothetical protein L228DRAFT_146947 [Xylona heveae TC161]KZF22130.1 hypothetical protein L228DRAFT_146947 [Xylona heveae TC161]
MVSGALPLVHAVSSFSCCPFSLLISVWEAACSLTMLFFFLLGSKLYSPCSFVHILSSLVHLVVIIIRRYVATFKYSRLLFSYSHRLCGLES